MDAIVKAHERLEKKANLKKGIQDVQEIIDKLKTARRTVQAGIKSLLFHKHFRTATQSKHTLIPRLHLDPGIEAITLAKLQAPIKQSFDKVNEDLIEITKGLNAYSKALEKVGTSYEQIQA